jgi:hypothetical protein
MDQKYSVLYDELVKLNKKYSAPVPRKREKGMLV